MLLILFVGSSYKSYGGYGGGSYIADFAENAFRQPGEFIDNEGDGYVIIKRLYTESDESNFFLN